VGLGPAVSISSGWDFTCALTVAGAVKCWGENAGGALGDGSTMDSPVPVDVVGMSSGVVAISAGEATACALTTGGAVKCWGANTQGQLGDDTTTDSPIPVDVAGLGSGVVAISAGYWSTCAIIAGGTVKCWGSSQQAHPGEGVPTADDLTPVDVTGLPSNISSLSVGAWQTCVLTTTGGVKCWGGNGYGQLGNGSTADSHVPVDVVGLSSGVVAISAGYYNTCAVTVAGAVKCWGEPITASPPDDVPVDVPGLSSGFLMVSTGDSCMCAVATTGGVKCWGLNWHGALGDGSTASSVTPVDVVGLSSAVQVSTGVGHTCALMADGTVKCWGRNNHGQLGNGSTTESHVPVDVVGL
jgi:alpha-tubulin suppressor-like RCC1 family protein